MTTRSDRNTLFIPLVTIMLASWSLVARASGRHLDVVTGQPGVAGLAEHVLVKPPGHYLLRGVHAVLGKEEVVVPHKLKEEHHEVALVPRLQEPKRSPRLIVLLVFRRRHHSRHHHHHHHHHGTPAPATPPTVSTFPRAIVTFSTTSGASKPTYCLLVGVIFSFCFFLIKQLQ